MVLLLLIQIVVIVLRIIVTVLIVIIIVIVIVIDLLSGRPGCFWFECFAIKQNKVAFSILCWAVAGGFSMDFL